MRRTPTWLKQGVSYGVVGVLQLVVDWMCFVALTGMGLATVPANVVGRVVGAGLGFWLNGAFTFRDGGRARLGWRALLRFTVSWLVMTVLSTAAVAGIDRYAGLGAAWLLKPAVDALLALLGFVASRHWIYR